MGSIEYHLEELKIALDKADDRCILPSLLDSDRAILDVGCGIGQSFIALDCADRLCVGLDIDEGAVKYGIDNYGAKINFILADAKHMPLPSNTFNLVYCRVSLPYTNIPKVIKEIRRVLTADGRVWMTLHGKCTATKCLKEAVEDRNIKHIIHVIYVLGNGYLLEYCGVVCPFIDGHYESWQSASAMKRLLIRNGFKVNAYEVGAHTVVEGRLV
jgi:ubiquinone/menaquinone biosynthesis C-methylase UbiE